MAITVSLLFFAAAFFTGANAFGGKHPQFNHTCAFCGCYWNYDNRDIKLPNLPYAYVVYPTEDECLAHCWADSQCQSVEYGVSGGWPGIVCELYKVQALPNLLQYQWAFNYHEKMPANMCSLQVLVPAIPSDQDVETPDQDYLDFATFRKEFARRPNPYNWGRKKRHAFKSSRRARDSRVRRSALSRAQRRTQDMLAQGLRTFK